MVISRFLVRRKTEQVRQDERLTPEIGDDVKAGEGKEIVGNIFSSTWKSRGGRVFKRTNQSRTANNTRSTAPRLSYPFRQACEFQPASLPSPLSLRPTSRALSSHLGIRLYAFIAGNCRREPIRGAFGEKQRGRNKKVSKSAIIKTGP